MWRICFWLVPTANTAFSLVIFTFLVLGVGLGRLALSSVLCYFFLPLGLIAASAVSHRHFSIAFGVGFSFLRPSCWCLVTRVYRAAPDLLN